MPGATNQYINTSWVSMKILVQLLNKLVCTEQFSRQWQPDFQKEFAVGDTITVKFPWRPSVIDSMTYSAQNIERISTTITLDKWKQIPFEWDDYERAVNLERSESELDENYWDPCSSAMAQEFDSECCLLAYQAASTVVGVLGTNPTTPEIFYTARQKMLEKACPAGPKVMLISSSCMTSIGTNLYNTMHPADEMDRLWKDGAIGKLANFKFFESNTLYNHTAGTWAGAVTVTGASQSGSSLIITGTSGDTINKGDKFSIANVNQTNPMTKRKAGPTAVQHFTSRDDYTLTGSADTISIYPAIYGPSSQYQNVDALPANGAALTLWPGTSSPSGKSGVVGLALSKFAFMLVGTKLYLPKSVEGAGQAQDPNSGLAIRKVRAWDEIESLQINRMDSLFGTGVGYQDAGCICVAMG